METSGSRVQGDSWNMSTAIPCFNEIEKYINEIENRKCLSP